MKRYIKTQNYINLDDDIQTLIDEFDPYIEETQTDTDVDAIGYGWVAYRIKDRNSDFDEWIDVRLDEDGNIEEWDWNRQVFFDRSYTDDKNIRTILRDPRIVEKVDAILRGEKMKKYIKANNDLSVNAIGKFIDKAVKELEELGEEDGYSYTYYYDLDPDLRLVIAWMDRFEEDNGHNGYEICAKIATAHDDLVDYEWAFMPYDEETGDVWDTEVSNPSSQDASWYLDQYSAIREAYENGEIVIPGADKYE